MYKTKIIETQTNLGENNFAIAEGLSKKINEFLKENIGIRLIDIKFSSGCDESTNYIYALIIYQEKND